VSIKSTFFGSTLRILGTVVVALIVLVGGGFLLGVFGVPSVTGVQNQFGTVNDTATVIETDLSVNNPNPIGVALGGASVNYTVFMNDVPMASGLKEGLAVGSGNSTLNFTTVMRNEQIPQWWYTHIREDEETQVLIDARVRSSTLGGQTVELPQEKTVETDIVGAFNSDETRPVDANQPVVSDPVLYINETSADWDDENLSPEQTPINMSFTVYNPKPAPYTVTRIGYNITMNEIAVGEGGTEEAIVIPPGETRTIRANTVINNTRLDEWWVSHLQNNQVTRLYIDFSLVVESEAFGQVPGESGTITLPADPLDYEETIETDMFGTKPEDGGTTGDDSADDDADDGSDDSGGETDDSTQTAEPTTTDDGGVLDDSDDSTPTEESTPTETPTAEPTPTETPTEDGGGILEDRRIPGRAP